MAGAKNQVIEGDYKGKPIVIAAMTGVAQIGGFKNIKLTSETVEEYEIMDSQSKTSGTSAVARAAVGSFFLGPIGLLAGASAKKKGTHLIAVQFKDGKKSLLEVDDKINKAIIQKCF
ncbi:MAG: hypothetical protein ACK5LX_10880 [Oscillospiraceae bacterium]